MVSGEMKPALALALVLVAAAAVAAPCGDVSCWPARPDGVDPSWIYCSSMFGQRWVPASDCSASGGRCVDCSGAPTPTPTPTPVPTPPPSGQVAPAPMAILAYIKDGVYPRVPLPWVQDVLGYIRYGNVGGWYGEIWIVDPLLPKQPLRFRVVLSPDQRPLP